MLLCVVCVPFVADSLSANGRRDIRTMVLGKEGTGGGIFLQYSLTLRLTLARVDSIKMLFQTTFTLSGFISAGSTD